MFNPPHISAGKNFITLIPISRSFSISLGVATPGIIVIFSFLQKSITLGFEPGLTIKSAPTAIASLACSIVSTVPAPTVQSENFSFITAMAFNAFSVRRVTSIQFIFPFLNASANKTACSSSFTVITGIIPASLILVKISIYTLHLFLI